MAGVEKNSTHNPYVLRPVNASVVLSAPRPTLYQTDVRNQPAGPSAPQNSKDTGALLVRPFAVPATFSFVWMDIHFEGVVQKDDDNGGRP